MLSSHRHTLVDDSHGRVTLMPWLGASRDERKKAFRGNQALAIVERWRRKGGRRGLVQVASWLAADRGEVRGMSEEALVEQIRKAVRAHRLIALPGWVEGKKRERAPLVPVVEEVVLPKVQARREATDSDAEPTIRLVNLESRYFVPGKETVRVSYAIDGPVEKAASVKLVVKSLPGGPQGAGVVGRLPVAAPYEGMGEMQWDGHLESKEQLITLAESPYHLWFELTSRSGHHSVSNPTMVELEVHSVSIRVDERGPLSVPEGQRRMFERLRTELALNGAPNDSFGRLALDGPVFPTDYRELGKTTSAVEYAAAMGKGVDVPLLADINLKSKAGKGRRSPAAVRGTWLEWTVTYDDKGQFAKSLEGRGAAPSQKRFLTSVASRDEKTGVPSGSGVHRLVGGRRRPRGGIEETFWKAAGSWAFRPDRQPPDVAVTECGGEVDAPADSGIYFISGRIAGDTYRIRATLEAKNSHGSFDGSAPEPDVTLHSPTVALTIWRRVPIVADWFVGPLGTGKDGGWTVEALGVLKAFQPAALQVEVEPGVVATNAGPHWVREYQKVVDRAVKEGWPFLADALERDNQGYPVRFRPYAEFLQARAARGPDEQSGRQIEDLFYAGTEREYRLQCEKHFNTVFGQVAATFHRQYPDGGITVMKFASGGPHNMEVGEETGGFFSLVPGWSTRRRTAVFLFDYDVGGMIAAHEIGHALFLAHAPGHDEGRESPLHVASMAHDQHDVCLMSYVSDAKHLCGLCLLKLAGCEYWKIRNDGTIDG
jgi:hypothetical protein